MNYICPQDQIANRQISKQRLKCSLLYPHKQRKIHSSNEFSFKIKIFILEVLIKNYCRALLNIINFFLNELMLQNKRSIMNRIKIISFYPSPYPNLHISTELLIPLLAHHQLYQQLAYLFPLTSSPHKQQLKNIQTPSHQIYEQSLVLKQFQLSVDFIQIMSDKHNDSIQEHLTNSIRRAKERIYSKAISAYSNNDSQYNNHQYQMRERTISERSVLPQSLKEDKSVVASAMKVLQQKIVALQQQNRDLKKRLEMAERQSKGKQIIRQKDDNMQLQKALTDLKAKQLQVKKITRQNNELHLRYSQLNERMQELEEDLEKALKNNKQQNKISKTKKEQSEKIEIYEARILEKDIKIAKLQQSIKELQKANHTQQESIQNLSNKVDEEKKMNLKWIKMYNAQLDKKQNRSIVANQIQSHTQKKSIQKGMSFQVTEIIRKNKQLQQNLQRNKIKIADLNRQRKKAQDKCFKVQQIALQIADQITKSMSNPPSHLKYLTAQIMKLDGGHYNDSAINCSRKSRLQDRSGSKQRKRSLKISDLNSSSKKSKSRSKSKLTRKPIQKQSRYIIPDQLLQN